MPTTIKTYLFDLTPTQMGHVDKILKAYMDMSYATISPHNPIDPETAALITAIIHFRNQYRQQ